jgi:signal transduction histidine kinase
MQQQIRNKYEQSKNRFRTIISGISHDFRTPLTASLGYLQMIEKSGELSPSNAEYLSIVKQKNRYLKEMSDEFFEMTKLQQEEEKCELEEVNLSNILTEMLLEQHTWIEKKGIETEFDIAEGIVIQSNPHYLARMINNIFSNAQKYSEERLEVTLMREEEQIVLRVNNMFADVVTVDVNRVFEPFYRMDSRTENGSGLGLYVVKLLADKLGWKVVAETQNGIFSIILYMY